MRLVICAIVCAISLAVAAPAQAGQCQKGFAWGGRCWTSKDGGRFERWLIEHGVNPIGWAKRNPELAATFGRDWPGVQWHRLERRFDLALRHASSFWHVSYRWLWACAASEGGTDPRRVAIGSAGDTGWFQFLPSTWRWMSSESWRAGGKHSPPATYRRIDSVVGQTWTASWAFSRGLSFHWYGSGC